MASMSVRLAVAGAAFYLALEGTAEAAKGVKKVAPANAGANPGANTPRTISGVVTNVTKQNGGAAMHVRTAHHHKKQGVVNAAAVAGGNPQNHSHTFNVTMATHFAHQNGTPASVFSLHRGERVRVQATGHQAMNVQILSQHRTRGTFARYRANMYRPHLHQMHVHRRR
jgi:hypothetical protein